MIKVALYARVSTADQSTEQQQFRLREYASRRGWEYKVFSETESSRKTRPVKYKLMQLLRQGEFDGVVVWKLDRWARSLGEMAIEVEELDKRGITFISIQEGIDLSTSTGRLQFHILGAMAQFERDLIRERTLEGLERAKRNGQKLGRPKGAKDKKKRRQRRS